MTGPRLLAQGRAVLRQILASLVAHWHRIYLPSRSYGSNPWVRKMPWRRAWLPTPVFSPGEPCGQRSLAGCSPQGLKESDTTKPLNNGSPLEMTVPQLPAQELRRV